MIWTICLLLAVDCQADQSLAEVKIPPALSAGLRHFLDLADSAETVTFDLEKVAGVLDFINIPGKDAALYHADHITGAPSAYYEFDIHQNLQKIVAYSFNPDIPYIATVPSSARLLHWLDSRKNRQSAPRIGRYLDQLDSPVVIKGLQHMEITPDTHSGAYYAYNVHQTVVLFKYRQRNILVTVSKQVDVSAVGRKGYVLGTDDDWDYFYSGKPGLTIPALGWVKSYMYRSSGINIYDEVDPVDSTVRCAVFKWLRAGWAGINMVRRQHIYSGLKRFAKPMKEILEYPLLPSVESMTANFSRIRGFSEDTLRSKMKIYSGILQNRYDGGGRHIGKLSAKLTRDKHHWALMSRDEMESALIIEYMKLAVGKTRPEEVRELLDLTR
ncbi:MAG: hypothetical protein GY770_10210 [Aestuariibacter sp.]|nr:hypothetical protein [Aestuariibacter sp.]